MSPALPSGTDAVAGTDAVGCGSSSSIVPSPSSSVIVAPTAPLSTTSNVSSASSSRSPFTVIEIFRSSFRPAKRTFPSRAMKSAGLFALPTTVAKETVAFPRCDEVTVNVAETVAALPRSR